MENDYGFCFHCGAEIPSGAEFCPECGRSLAGDTRRDESYLRVRNPMSFIILLMGLFAAVSIIEGIYAVFLNDLFMSSLEMLNDSNLDSYVSSLGLESKEELAEIIYKEGIVTLAQGIMVAIACMLCIKRRFWGLTIALCLIATFMMLVPLVFMTSEMIRSEIISMILQMCIGLLVVRGLYINKGQFNKR